MLICRSQGARLREKANNTINVNDEDSEAEESDDEEVDEELGFISPLDHVDPYATFKHALTSTSFSPSIPVPSLINFLPSLPNEKSRHVPGINYLVEHRTTDCSYGDHGYSREECQ